LENMSGIVVITHHDRLGRFCPGGLGVSHGIPCNVFHPLMPRSGVLVVRRGPE